MHTAIPIIFEDIVEHTRRQAKIRGNELGGVDSPLSRQRAVDGARTRDPRLGKPMLYRLSYYRNMVSPF